jgi:hypothetical protein
VLIIVEGLDRTGKTTLAERLARDARARVRHFDKPQQHPLDEYVRPLVGAPPHVIFDRYHLGERVWPAIFGRKSEYDDAMHHYVELALESRGAILVKPRREWNPNELEEALANEPVDAVQYREAQTRFTEEFRDTLLPVTNWCLCHDTATGRELIIELAKVREHWARKPHEAHSRWVGHYLPNVLLVGDVAGPKQTAWNLPFVPYRATSGHFLMSELRGVNVELRPAIVNAHQPDGENEDVLNLWSLLGEPPIVALGRNAARKLRMNGGLPHAEVQHPQYVRRFLRRNGAGWYAQQIKEAAGL